jgi:hypothetical protein
MLVAADGAGSAPQGAEGATMAVDAAVLAMSRMLDEHAGPLDRSPLSAALVGAAVRAARERIEQAARDLADAPAPASTERGDASDDSSERPIDRFATTLLVAAVTPWHLAAVQIGDGYVVRFTDRDAFERLFQPTRGRFANETCFLTSSASLDALAARGQVQTFVASVDGTAGIALITDGLEPVAMDMRAGGVPHAPFFAGLVDALSRHDPETFAGHVERYLRGSAKIRERSDDDKTLVLALDACPSPSDRARRPAQSEPAPPGLPDPTRLGVEA